LVFIIIFINSKIDKGVVMHELFGIYEKLYFKSLEDRDELINRVNVNFSFYISMLAIIFYMIRMIDYDHCIFILAIFYILLLCSLILMFTSLYFTYKALSSNYDYRYIPSFKKMGEYLEKLISYLEKPSHFNTTNADTLYVTDTQKAIKSTLFMIVGKCCDENNKLNKRRMFFVRK